MFVILRERSDRENLYNILHQMIEIAAGSPGIKTIIYKTGRPRNDTSVNNIKYL